MELSLNSDYNNNLVVANAITVPFYTPQNLIADDCINCVECGWRQLVDLDINCDKIMEISPPMC